MSGFEAKKAFIFELEVHDHGGGKKEMKIEKKIKMSMWEEWPNS